MSRADHQEIADLVNAHHPGTATFVEIKKMSHNFTIHPSMGDSFSGDNASYNPEIFRTISKWLAVRKGD